MLRFPLPLAAFAALGLSASALAADLKTQLDAVAGQIDSKLAKGAHTAAALSAELKSLDTLLKEHQAEKNDQTVRIISMRAMLLAELGQEDQALAQLKQAQTDYAGIEYAKDFPSMIATLESGAKARAVRKNLVAGKPFPDFHEKDVAGQPLSVSALKGKVVLVDFWATWCGPCVAELPHVLASYQKHHGQGLEVIGISLDMDQKDLTAFIKEKQVPWAQYLDSENKLADTYGVESIPSTFLLDREGKIIASDLRGEELEAAITKALK